MMDIIDFLNSAGASATGGIVSATAIALAAKVKSAFKGKSITQEALDKLMVENAEIKNSVVKLQEELITANITTNIRKNTGVIIPNGQNNTVNIYNYPTDIAEQDISRETLSDERLLKIIHSLMSLSGRGLSESESRKAKGLRERISALFDIQLTSSTIFDSIIASKQLQKIDIIDINNLRNNEIYNYQDRSLIVSALTLAALNDFDEEKIYLLIDFLTDFEEITWQRALVGLLLVITRYYELLKLPELEQEKIKISRRFEELKSIPRIQNNVMIIDNILRNGCYSMEKCTNCPLYKNKENNTIRLFKMFLGNDISFNKEDVSDIQECLTRTDSLGALMRALYIPEKVTELANKVENGGLVTIATNDIFEYINFKNYVKLHEFNPLALNLKDDLFSKPQKWFYPFEMDSKISKTIAAKYPKNLDINYTDFKNLIVFSKSISDIDKIYILNHINELSEDFIYYIICIAYMEQLLCYGEDEIKILYIKIIRDLYRFSVLFPEIQKGHFNETIELYNPIALENIITEVTKIKLNAQFLFQHDDYQKSIDLLQTIPIDKHDFEINALFAKNYIWLKENNLAIPYLNNVLKQLDKCTLKEKAKWYRSAKNLYYKTDSKKYINFLKKETSIREKIFKESLNNDEDSIVTEKGIELANCYFDFCVEFHNNINNKEQSFFYFIKYLNVFFLIPNIEDEKFHEILESKKEWLYTLFSPNILKDNSNFIQEKVKKEISKKLFDKICELDKTYLQINQWNTSTHYNAALNHANNIYEEIEPFVRNEKETNPNNRDIQIFHFIVNGTDNKVDFSCNKILSHKAEGVLQALTQHVTTNLLLHNLLSEEKPSIEDIKDNVLIELPNWYLWDFNKLSIWCNLFCSLCNQEKYSEAKEALEVFRNTFKSIEKQPLEEQVHWIDIAYELYKNLDNDTALLELFIDTLRYLNRIQIISSIDNNKLQKIIEFMKSRWKDVFVNYLSILFANSLFDVFKNNIENEINSKLLIEVQNLYVIQHTFSSPDIMNISKYYDNALNYARDIYDTILPVVQSVKEEENNEYENIMIPFISKTDNFDVSFPIDELLDSKEYCVLGYIVYEVEKRIRSYYLDTFFGNLLSDECEHIASETIRDEVLLKVLDLTIPTPKS